MSSKMFAFYEDKLKFALRRNANINLSSYPIRSSFSSTC